MKLINRFKKGLLDPCLFVKYLNSKSLLKWMSDEQFVRLLYRSRFGHKLNLVNPKNFNEKIQWLKIYGYKDEYTQLVDKIAARDVIREKIGDEYLIPLVGGPWSSTSEIDISLLPNQFVLKCNHDCGSVIVCKDKNSFDFTKAFSKLDSCLSRNYYEQSRERPYKNIVPKVFAEKFMYNPNEDDLVVYKIFNFNGEPKIIQNIQGDKTENETIDYFDIEWRLLDLRQNFPNSQIPKNKPETLDKMLELAKVLSEGFPFLRTDFYNVMGQIYFSEFTLYTDAGIEEFSPKTWDTILGDWVDLTK